MAAAAHAKRFTERLKAIRIDVLGMLGLVYPEGMAAESIYRKSGSALTEIEMIGVLRVMITRGEIVRSENRAGIYVYRLADAVAERGTINRVPAEIKIGHQGKRRYGELIGAVRREIINASDPVSGAVLGRKYGRSVRQCLKMLRDKGEIELAHKEGAVRFWAAPGRSLDV